MQSTKIERVTIFIPADLNTEIRVEAARTRKNISDIVREILEKHFAAKAII